MADDKSADSKKLLFAGLGVAAVGAVIGGYFLFAPEEQETGPTSLNTSNLQSYSSTGKARYDKQYDALRTEYNQRNSQDAEQNGGNFISTLKAANPTDADYGNKPQRAHYDWNKPQTQTVATNSANDGAQQKERERQQKIMDQMLQKIEAARTPVSGMALAAPLGSAGGKDGQGGDFAGWTQSVFPQANAQPPVQTDKEKQAEQRGSRLIAAYTVVPALMDGAMDSDDQNSPITAHVATGAQKGTVFYSNQNRLAGQGIRVNFSGMTINGTECKVKAHAVNAETMKASIASDVHNRWFENVIIPAIGNGVGRTGQLYEDSNSQMILTDNGNAYRSTGTPSGKAIAGTIIGGIGEGVGRQMERMAQTRPFTQVTTDRNDVVGVMFDAPVYEGDCGEGVLSQSGGDQQTMQQPVPTVASAPEPQQQYVPAPQYTQPAPYNSYSNYPRGYYR